MSLAIVRVSEYLELKEQAESGNEGSQTEVTEVTEVEPKPEDDVTEDAIRARAGDICAAAPDGKGKAKCIEIIKKIGGGKISDLKTPKQRKDCLAELDEAYKALDL